MKKYGKNDGKVIGPLKDLKNSDEKTEKDLKEESKDTSESK
jgi:hypothetical protein